MVAAAGVASFSLIPVAGFSGATPADAAPQVPGSVAAPTASSVTQSCQMPNPTAVLGPPASLPANPLTTVVSPPGGIYTMSVTGTDIYVVNGNGVYTYTLSGALVTHFSLPGVITTNTFSG